MRLVQGRNCRLWRKQEYRALMHCEGLNLSTVSYILIPYSVRPHKSSLRSRQVRERLWGFPLWSSRNFFSAFRPRPTAVVSAIRPECLMAHSAVFWLFRTARSKATERNDPENIPLFHRFEKPTRFLRVTVALFNPLKASFFLNCVKNEQFHKRSFLCCIFHHF